MQKKQNLYIAVATLFIAWAGMASASTITTILGTDTLSASRSVINTNFSNLNADKIEQSTTTLARLTTLAGLASIGSVGATTTGVGGISLSGGCFAMNSVCLSASLLGASSFAYPWSTPLVGSYMSTTSTLSISGGIISTASSTLANLKTTTVTFSGLTLGSLAVGSDGVVYKAATTTFSTGLTYTNGVVTCDVATGSVPGCLAAADWTIFNNSADFAYPFTNGLGYFATTTGGIFNASTTLQVANLGSVVGTGGADFGGASFFEIPNGTAPTCDDVGEICHDTSDNMILVDDFVVAKVNVKIWSVTVASTSPAFISAGLLPVPLQRDGYTITGISCYVLTGTSKVIAVEDASANSSEDITCAATATNDDGSITNATYTASELSSIDFGATTGSVDYVTIAVFGQWTRE